MYWCEFTLSVYRRFLRGTALVDDGIRPDAESHAPVINARFVPCFLLQCPGPCRILGRSFRPRREAADPSLENMEGIAGLICLCPRGEVWSAGVSVVLSLYLCFEFLRVTSDQMKYLIHQDHQSVHASLVAHATFPRTLLWLLPTYREFQYSLRLQGLLFLPQCSLGSLGMVYVTWGRGHS